MVAPRAKLLSYALCSSSKSPSSELITQTKSEVDHKNRKLLYQIFIKNYFSYQKKTSEKLNRKIRDSERKK